MTRARPGAVRRGPQRNRERHCRTGPLPPAAPPPSIVQDVAPSRRTPLAPWDPNYEVEGRLWRQRPRQRQQQQGVRSGSVISFSGRTLCHPSLWPLYEASSSGGLRPPVPTTGNTHGDAGFPMLCCEDVFLSDPLLPCGQRIPLNLAESTRQVMRSLQLLLPPPIMSSWVVPTPSPGSSTALLSGSELIALAGLLQMSQGEGTPNSSVAPNPPADSLELASDDRHPTGDPSCPHVPDSCLPWTPDTHSL